MATRISTQTTGTPTNNKKFTFSVWLKRAIYDGGHKVYIHERGPGHAHTHKVEFGFSTSNYFTFGTWNGSAEYYSATTQKFFDCNAWYHFVIACDSTQATDSDRLKFYCNGEQITSFSTGPSYPAQNWVFDSNTWTHFIGQYVSSAGQSNPYEGCMSDFCFVDGQQLTPSSFGETDTDTGEWRVKDFVAGDITWGTNGYRILKDGNSLTDVSSNSHNFTLDTGTLTRTEDCPSNIMATLDTNSPTGGGFSGNSGTWANGNTKFTTSNSSSNFGVPLSTLGMNKGKYYAECKKISGNQGLIGIRGWQGTSTNNYLGDTPADYAIYTDGYMYTNNTQTDISGSSYSNDDIIGVFVDCDNWKLYFSKNGTIMNTTGHTITDITGDTNARSLGAYFFGTTEWDSSGNGTWEWNFGNGAFSDAQLTGTTYNGANGKGIFKYDPNNITLDGVSKSFNALSTKGLNA